MKKMIQKFNNEDVSIIIDTKTVDWLINNTEVKVFDPISFKGYQRKIDTKHMLEIVSYITSSEENFYFPSSIICTCNDDYYNNSHLRIVDGQHRVEAFRYIKHSNEAIYKKIENMQLPVIILENPKIEIEVNTFITINKKTKKVDTSLAYVLRNMIINKNNPSEMQTHFKEYLAVELADKINKNENSIWFNKILYEGNVKYNVQTISLNAFVKSTRKVIASLCKKNLIELNWKSIEEINTIVENLVSLTDSIWLNIKRKFSNIFDSDNIEDLSIIMGSIGYSSINRCVSFYINNNSFSDFNDLLNKIPHFINSLVLKEKDWYQGGLYSKFSSESGYSIIAKELLANHFGTNN